jgi:predicted ester cyclase
MIKESIAAALIAFSQFEASMQVPLQMAIIFSPKSQPPTSEEQLKLTTFQFLDAFCKNDLDKIKEITTSRCTIESLLDKRFTSFHKLSNESNLLIKRMEIFHQAFDSISVKVEKMVVGSGEVALFCEFTMRQTGPFQNILPTNQFITLRTALFIEFTTGKINKIFDSPDELSFFRQLGNLPL